MKSEQMGAGSPKEELSDVEKEKVDKGLIEKYGQEFFKKLMKNYDSSFRLSGIDHIEVEEKIVDTKDGQGKEFIVSYISYGDPNESESDFIVKDKFFATMDNNIYATSSSVYTNFSEENKIEE